MKLAQNKGCQIFSFRLVERECPVYSVTLINICFEQSLYTMIQCVCVHCKRGSANNIVIIALVVAVGYKPMP